MKKPIIFMFMLFCLFNCAKAELVNYKAPDGSSLNDDFTVKVRQKGKEWESVAVYLAKVAKVEAAVKTIENTSFCYFDFSGNVEVAITYNKGAIKTSRIRPFSSVANVKANTITFSLSAPKNLSIEVNGDIFHNLHLFANPLETNRPLPSDAGVLYYGPGIHNVDSVNVKSNQIIYIAGGAIVRGSFLLDHVKNVKIIGRGILEHSAKSIDITFSENVVVDGIIVLNPKHYTVTIGQSKDVAIRNIKSFSSEGWGDGIDVFCSSNISLEGLFMRNSDDCIAIYGHRWKYYGNAKNISVKNSTLWADVAHPFMIGTHGDPPHPDTLGDMEFKNIDILEQHEDQIDYQGCLALNSGDNNLLSNIRFEDIRIDDIRNGQLVNMRIMFNHKYNTAAGMGIENIYFKNISYTGMHANMSIIAGYDETHRIKNVVFENFIINGKVIFDKMPGKPAWYKTGDMANIFVGEHVDSVSFIPSSNVGFNAVH